MLSRFPGKSLPSPLLARHPSTFTARWGQRQVLATIIFFPFPLFITSVSSHISVRGPGKRSHYRCSWGLTFHQFSKCERCFSAWNGSFASQPFCLNLAQNGPIFLPAFESVSAMQPEEQHKQRRTVQLTTSRLCLLSWKPCIFHSCQLFLQRRAPIWHCDSHCVNNTLKSPCGQPASGQVRWDLDKLRIQPGSEQRDQPEEKSPAKKVVFLTVALGRILPNIAASLSFTFPLHDGKAAQDR